MFYILGELYIERLLLNSCLALFFKPGITAFAPLTMCGAIVATAPTAPRVLPNAFNPLETFLASGLVPGPKGLDNGFLTLGLILLVISSSYPFICSR